MAIAEPAVADFRHDEYEKFKGLNQDNLKSKEPPETSEVKTLTGEVNIIDIIKNNRMW